MPLFPFGPELWPFQRFAMRAMGIKPSPLGLLVHPQFGLWHALRAAIVLPGMQVKVPAPHEVIHVCEKCDERYCLSACPVSAFTSSGFAVDACRGYLAGPATLPGGMTGPDCMGEGCAARNACPVGLEWRYGQAQIRFHMAAFSR
jgi:epoxyqueuosine reductase QueG